MMQNTFITNKDKLLSDIINGILPKSQSLDVLVGYFYFSGYKLISDKLIDKHVRILVGLDIDTRITKDKKKILDKINTTLKMGWKVEIVK